MVFIAEERNTWPMEKLIRFFKELFDWAEKDMVEMEYLPPVEPIKEVLVPIKPKKNMLDIFCEAIRDFEGKPGDQNYRNNNPGNYRYSPVGYLPKYGNVKRSKNNFAIFPTYELGWQYHQASVMHWAHLHPNWTIRDFFHHYAPPSDDNPTEAYAQNVAKKCGVTVETTLSVLFSQV
jgi:hypothetical protein